MPAQARGGLAVAAPLALAAPAFAQWTDAGGGDHGGWDYTPAGGATIGGTHVNVYNFNTIEGRTIKTGGAGPETVIQAEHLVLSGGQIDALAQELVLECGVVGEAGMWPSLLAPAYLGTAGPLPLYDWTDATDPSPPAVTFRLEVGTTGTVGPGGTVGGLVLTKTGLTASQYQHLAADGALADGTYFWRVGADDGVTIRWSEVWTFDVVPGGGGGPAGTGPDQDGSAGRGRGSCGFSLFFAGALRAPPILALVCAGLSALICSMGRRYP
jgi:hypothetical protein